MPNYTFLSRFKCEILSQKLKLNIHLTKSPKRDHIYKLCLYALEEHSCLILTNLGCTKRVLRQTGLIISTITHITAFYRLCHTGAKNRQRKIVTKFVIRRVCHTEGLKSWLIMKKMTHKNLNIVKKLVHVSDI